MNRPDLDHDHRCAGFLERLSRYLDDDVPDAERRAIERHLCECPCCEEVLASLKFTVATCHEKGRPALPLDVRKRAKARVTALLRQSPKVKSRAR
jgi:anti-sigma factor RsiW